jgi:CTP:molybdopterin cytidylyltransferase MocA
VSVAGIVLAAGEGSRFGSVKQLAPLAGRPLLEHVLATMSASCDRVALVLGAHAETVRAGVDLHGATPVVCEDWAKGTFASLQCGLLALGTADEAVVVALGDQPTLSSERIAAVLATDGLLVRALDNGAPSHPVVIRPGAALSPDALRTAPGIELGSLPDVDTQDQLVNVQLERASSLPGSGAGGSVRPPRTEPGIRERL